MGHEKPNKLNAVAGAKPALRLHRETIRELATPELDRVAGGRFELWSFPQFICEIVAITLQDCLTGFTDRC